MISTRLTLALAAAFASPAAFAAASAQGSLSHLSFQLIDLNPSDGITPWISFAQGAHSLVTASASQPLAAQTASADAPGVFGNASTSAEVSLAGAWASISGDALKTLAAGGFAAGLTPELLGQGRTSFSAEARGNDFWDRSFTLSPFTLLVISAQGHVRAATTIGMDEQSWTYESGYTSVELSVTGFGSDGSGSQSSIDGLYATASYQFGIDGQGNWVAMPQASDLQGSVTVSFLNLSTGDLQGSFSAHAWAGGHSALPAVPEPSGVALLLSGLGLVGWFGRRHARR